MDKFLEFMAEIMECEPDEITLDTDFRNDFDFDSLKGFSMICMLEEEYGKVISVQQFLDCKTIGDLYKYTEE